MARKTSTPGGDYEVGYKRPPKAGQFKKGEPSRNPKGRPQGSRNVSTILKAELSEKVQVRENGRLKKISKADVVVKKVVSSAGNGDVRYARLLFDLLRDAGELGGPPEAADDGPNARDEAVLEAYVKRLRRRSAS